MQCRHNLSFATALAVIGLSSASAAPPVIGGCQIFPANNYWNTPIDQLPVHPSSNTWQNNMRTKSNTNLNPATLWPDWGRLLDDGSGFNEIVGYGIPFVTVPGNQPNVPITFTYADESDPSPYPIPTNAPVEGGPGAGGDRHVLALNTGNCTIYELFAAETLNGGASWTADSGSIWPLNSNALRPDRWTSADAAGFAVLPGLLRWEEVQAGEITHAIRFTAQNIWGSTGGTGRKYLWPARHWSGLTNNANFPPMGARFRLKASFNISGYQADTQKILTAMKKYGLVLADGGSNWFLSGMSNTGWPSIVMSQLKSIIVSSAPDNHIFEVVDADVMTIDPNSAQAAQVPGIPANIVVTLSNTQASFAFTLPDNGGKPITSNVVNCAPGNLTASAATSPVLLTGLSNGVNYTCTMKSGNITGFGATSTAIPVTVGLPQFNLSASSMNFPVTNLGASSVSQSFLVTNAGSTNLTISAITLAGTHAGDFLVGGGTCTAITILAPMTSCSVSTMFTPTAIGARDATISIAGNAAGSPIVVVLSGIGRTVPSAPIANTSVVGNTEAFLRFSPPASDGGAPINQYTATCNPGAITASAATSPIHVTGLASLTPYTCTVRAVNAAGAGAASGNFSFTPVPNAAADLGAIFSRKTHATSGVFDLQVTETMSVNLATIEPRNPSPGYLLALRYTAPITDPGSVAIDVAGQNFTDYFVSFSGNEVLFHLGSIASGKILGINIVAVNGLNLGNSFVIGFLPGDLNGTRKVTAADLSATKALSGQNTDASNFRADVNLSGSINASDLSVIKARSGSVIP